METFKEYMINEGKFGKIIGGTLVALNLAGISPTLQAKNTQPKSEITIDKNNVSKLYRAIEKAETGSFKDKWIRTTYAPKDGSSAYGPVQITKHLVEDVAKRYPAFQNKHKKYIDKFIKQGDLF